MTRRLLVPLLLWLIPAVAFASPLGVYEGTGRACSGKLTITSRHITWKTPFSPCATTVYRLIERGRTNEGEHWVYAFDKPAKFCLYSVLLLQKADGQDAWNASGFPSLKAYRTGDDSQRLNCYLFKSE